MCIRFRWFGVVSFFVLLICCDVVSRPLLPVFIPGEGAATGRSESPKYGPGLHIAPPPGVSVIPFGLIQNRTWRGKALGCN